MISKKNNLPEDNNEFQNTFRIASITVSLIVGLYTFIEIFYKSSYADSFSLFTRFSLNEIFSEPVKRFLFLVIVSSLIISYLVLLIINTHKSRLLSPNKKSFIFLVVQSFIAINLSTIFLYINDVLAGFILPYSYRWLWIIIFSVIENSIFITSTQGIAFLDKSTVPYSIEIVFSFLLSMAFHYFCYTIGRFGAVQARQRLSFCRLNAELMATHQLQADNVRIAERIHISRELHDVVGHHLAALGIHLQLAQRTLSNETTQKSILDAQKISAQLLEDVRETVSELRNQKGINFFAAIQTLASGIESPAIEIYTADEFDDVDPLIAHTLFRAIQEILTNSIKHSKATLIKVELKRSANEQKICLFIQDNGFTSKKFFVYGNGLSGIKERVDMLNGFFEAYFDPSGIGFVVKLDVPEKILPC